MGWLCVVALVLGRVCAAAGVPNVSILVRVVRGRRSVRVRRSLASPRVLAAWRAVLVALPVVVGALSPTLEQEHLNGTFAKATLVSGTTSFA